MPPCLIEDHAALEAFISDIQPDLEADGLLAIDTEFFRETSYYPALGLVQLATRNHLACVDPLAFDAREGLAQLLLDPAVTKLFHSCSQDLEVLLQYLGELPCPVIDTQIAAAMLGEKDQISYANIVAQHLGVELEKSQTRTNWLKRPLSAKQLEYAAEDVLYLIPVYERLLDSLRAKDRVDWLQYDCEQLCRNAQRFEPDYDSCWQRVKGAHKLTSEQLGVVDALARWREHKAIALDKARRQVISDDFIVQAATRPPQNEQELRRCGKYARELDAQDFSDMLAAIRQAQAADPASWPQPAHQRLDNEQKQRIRKLMNTVEQRAEQLGVAQAILGSRKEIEKLAEGQRELNILSGWRYHAIGEQLVNQLAE